MTNKKIGNDGLRRKGSRGATAVMAIAIVVVGVLLFWLVDMAQASALISSAGAGTSLLFGGIEATLGEEELMVGLAVLLFAAVAVVAARKR